MRAVIIYNYKKYSTKENGTYFRVSYLRLPLRVGERAQAFKLADQVGVAIDEKTILFYLDGEIRKSYGYLEGQYGLVKLDTLKARGI